MIHNLFFSFLSLFILSSCAGGKLVRLSQFDYELGETAKLTVNSLKRYDGQLELEVLGLSMKEAMIAIKQDEIGCGVGDDQYDRVSVLNGKDRMIVLNRMTYVEFTIVCLNNTDLRVEEDPYIIIKNIYDFTNGKLGKSLGSDVKIKFK